MNYSILKVEIQCLRFKYLWIIFIALFLRNSIQVGLLWANEPVEGSQAHHSEDSSEKLKANVKRKGRMPREKEAEGTQAPNRFESGESIPKSIYRDEQTGQHYEVDTD